MSEIHTIGIERVKGEGGRFGPREFPATDKIVRADLVLLALGFVGPSNSA